jgi:hypothetical protein
MGQYPSNLCVRNYGKDYLSLQNYHLYQKDTITLIPSENTWRVWGFLKFTLGATSGTTWEAPLSTIQKLRELNFVDWSEWKSDEYIALERLVFYRVLLGETREQIRESIYEEEQAVPLITNMLEILYQKNKDMSDVLVQPAQRDQVDPVMLELIITDMMNRVNTYYVTK